LIAISVQEIWPAGKGKVIMYTFGALLLKLVEQCYHEKSDQAWTVESGASVYIHPWQKDVLNQLVRTNRVEEALDRVMANKSNIGDIDFAIVDTGAKVLDEFEEVPNELTNCKTRGLPVPDVQPEGLDEIPCHALARTVSDPPCSNFEFPRGPKKSSPLFIYPQRLMALQLYDPGRLLVERITIYLLNFLIKDKGYGTIDRNLRCK
jgi:hypothetical protein